MSEQGFATIPRSMLHDENVPRDAKLVYLVLSSHVGGNTSAWPSHRRIAGLLGMSLSTVKRQLAWLRDNSFVEWTERIGENKARVTNEYVLIAGSASTPVNKPGSHRTRGGSQGTDTGSHEAGGGPSENRPPAQGELPPSSVRATEGESLNESQSKTRSFKPPTSTADPRFGAFWDLYPKKIAKAEAFKAYQKAVKNGVDPDAICAGIKVFAAQSRSLEMKFIPYPATWLNQGRWEDEQPTRKSTVGAAADDSWIFQN